MAVYNVFTNDQLAQIAEQKPATKAAFQKIEGVGEARLEKDSPRFMEFLSGATEQLDETRQSPAGSDRGTE